MKRALVSTLILLILAAAGLASWVFLGRSSAEAASAAAPPNAEMRFVKMSPLFLPVLGARRIEQTIGLVVALELEDPANAGLVEQSGPKLTDAFISELYGSLDASRLGQGGLVNIDQVKGKLGRASDRVLGEGVVKEVLVQMVSQRPLSH